MIISSKPSASKNRRHVMRHAAIRKGAAGARLRAMSAAVVLALTASLPTVASATVMTLDVRDGTLHGANYVEVGDGVFYHVSFQDGSFASVFNNTLPTVFAGQAAATSAAEALRDRVFTSSYFDSVSNTTFDFDSVVNTTLGCENTTINQCSIYTPFGFPAPDDNSGNVLSVAFNNYVDEAEDDVTNGSFLRTRDLVSNGTAATFAVWTSVDAVAAVPEPASYMMMALGLLAVAGVSRRRSDTR